VLLESIIKVTCSDFLKNKITDILKKKMMFCQRNLIDFKEFFSSFMKCKEAIRKENIYNIYKNFDINNIGYLNINQVQKAFEKSYRNLDIEKAKEILKINNNSTLININFDDFLLLWENDETKSKSINNIKEKGKTEIFDENKFNYINSS